MSNEYHYVNQGDRIGTATREPQVRVKMEALRASFEFLEKDIVALDERLRIVSMPDSPSPKSDLQPIPNEPCQMADEIQGFIRRSEHLRGRLESIMSRLEI